MLRQEQGEPRRGLTRPRINELSKLFAAVYSQLHVYVLDMRLERSACNEELPLDCGIGFPLGKQSHDLILARAQPILLGNFAAPLRYALAAQAFLR